MFKWWQRERKNRRSKARGGAAPRGSQGSALKAFRSVAPEEPTHEHRWIRWLSEKPTPWYFGAEGNRNQVSLYRHRMNRWVKKGYRCIGRTVFQRRCKSRKSQVFSTGWTGEASVHTIGVMTSAHPGHLKFAGVAGDPTHTQEHLQAIQEHQDHILSP